MPEPAAAGLRESRPLGPDLSGLASKLELGWLISWLKDPRGISPTTRMPDFRLRGEESGHLAAFLLDERNSGFEEKDAPSVSLEDLREAARDAAATRLSIDEAQEAISRLSSGDLALIAGEATIRRYGCGGCHAIAGFEDTPPIGPDLTAVASKPLQQFDFGLLDVRRTLSDWLRVKLSDPRAFDRGRIKRPNERLRMGNFDLDPAEIDYLLTFLLGLRDVSPPEHRRPRPDTLRSALRQGRSLSAEFGCTACHETESAESEIGPFFSDPALAPPGLKGQGRRVRAEWLAAYLRDPSLVIRPWLNVRMPSYDWDEETVQDWVRYLRAADGLEMAIEPPAVSVLSKAAAAAGRSVFVELECRNCHDGPPYRSLFDRLRAAPPYPLARERLRPEWVRHFLADPQAVLPGTRMPSFFYVAGRPITPDAESRIEALTAFLFLQD